MISNCKMGCRYLVCELIWIAWDETRVYDGSAGSVEDVLLITFPLFLPF